MVEDGASVEAREVMTRDSTGRARALTIAGSDSGGGAGIQADLKTFAAFGVYGTSAITALTAQNTLGVTGVHVVPAEFVTAQVEAVVSDIGCDAVKTGMLATSSTVEAVVAVVDALELPNLVVDPVMVSKSGDRLLDADAVHAVRASLLRRARIVTPNLPEAEVLADIRIASRGDMREAARRIAALGPAAVLVKGGHLPGAEVVDVLYDRGTFHEFVGRALPDAVEAAKAYVAGAMRRGVPVGRGHQPLDHFWRA
jgi:hydroxymethylpyrimidine/phosphomethylpyrimidine kinase